MTPGVGLVVFVQFCLWREQLVERHSLPSSSSSSSFPSSFSFSLPSPSLSEEEEDAEDEDDLLEELLSSSVEKRHCVIMCDKENLSHWWGEDRENPRGEPLSLDRALVRSRLEVHPEDFPILTSSTWFIIYLAYFLPKSHCNQMFFVLESIWPIYRIGKSRLISLSDVITTYVCTHSRTRNG